MPQDFSLYSQSEISSHRPPNYKFMNIALKMDATGGERLLDSLGNRILTIEGTLEKQNAKLRKPSPCFVEVGS